MAHLTVWKPIFHMETRKMPKTNICSKIVIECIPSIRKENKSPPAPQKKKKKTQFLPHYMGSEQVIGADGCPFVARL